MEQMREQDRLQTHAHVSLCFVQIHCARLWDNMPSAYIITIKILFMDLTWSFSVNNHETLSAY